MTEDLPVLVVDAANVVGSVPDGWWRDRAGATERLRDSLVDVATRGVPEWVNGPVAVVLVVEGRARSVGPVDGVEVVSASGSGDDAIVEYVGSLGGRRVAVATADRELRDRVRALGAEVLGPRSVR
jgi:YacP-like NYN domain